MSGSRSGYVPFSDFSFGGVSVSNITNGISVDQTFVYLSYPLLMRCAITTNPYILPLMTIFQVGVLSKVDYPVALQSMMLRLVLVSR